MNSFDELTEGTTGQDSASAARPTWTLALVFKVVTAKKLKLSMSKIKSDRAHMGSH